MEKLLRLPSHLLRVQRSTVVVLIVLTAAVFALTSWLTPQRTTVAATVVGHPVSLGEIVVESERPALDREEILWLARCIYSETKRPREQELVAWVVRNRVESSFRGKDSYSGVVLDPWQFSAFNLNSPKRGHYMQLDDSSTAAGWQTAVRIAEKVVQAPASKRPFSETTRHFYSEQSMVGKSKPNWAGNRPPVKLDRRVDPRRFRFFDAIS